MKLVTRDTDYALRAICFIAQQKEKVVSVAQLVKILRIPQPFLRKILQILNKKKILKSYKGQGGGFLLARPAHKIFLVGLIEIFQGQLNFNECLFKKKACPNIKRCALRKKITRIENYVIKELKAITIAALLK